MNKKQKKNAHDVAVDLMEPTGKGAELEMVETEVWWV